MFAIIIIINNILPKMNPTNFACVITIIVFHEANTNGKQNNYLHVISDAKGRFIGYFSSDNIVTK